MSPDKAHVSCTDPFQLIMVNIIVSRALVSNRGTHGCETSLVFSLHPLCKQPQAICSNHRKDEI